MAAAIKTARDSAPDGRVRRWTARLGRPAAIALIAALAACAGPPAPAPSGDQALAERAARLARELILVDTHVDLPYRLNKQWEDVSVRTPGGDFDYERARAGGLDAPFMSIYVPASYQETGGAKELADRLIDMVEDLERRWPDRFAVARSAADVRRQSAAGLISLPMGMENGAPIEDDLGNLEHFWRRGIRYVTLTHSENNQICDSSYAEERRWGGLSPFGRQVVAEMNRLGIMIDVSHLSDATVDQVLELSAAPVIASHSSCRAFTPDWERNLDDERIRRLAAAGGVIHVNFGSAFLTAEANRQSQALWESFGAYKDEHGLADDDPAADAYLEQLKRENPMSLADVTDVADHIDHVVALVGVDHVGLGSDFDGVGETTPTGLEDVSFYPNLLRALLERGYDEEDLRKICGENTLRVWEEVEAVARRL